MEVNAARFLQLGFANVFEFLNGILKLEPLAFYRLPSIKDVNRSGVTDSEMSLDADFAARQNRTMTDATDTLYLERRDSSRNMARYYALSVESDMFDAVLAVRRWGRIGLWSRQIALPCPDHETAVAVLAEIAAAKRKRGYLEPTRPR